MASITYSFQNVTAALIGPGGVISLANGAGPANEGITFDTNDINEMTVGADGYGMHSLSADKSGRVVARFLKTSPTNSLLMGLYNFQRANAAAHGQNTITLVDIARGDSVTCEQVAFKKAPSLNYGTNAGIVEWEFDAVRINKVIGGL